MHPRTKYLKNQLYYTYNQTLTPEKILENFTTHITFTSGDSHTEDTPTAKLGSTIERLLTGPAAKMGMIKMFKIIDPIDDCIVFLAQDNKTVFPAPKPVTKAPVISRESDATVYKNI